MFQKWHLMQLKAGDCEGVSRSTERKGGGSRRSRAEDGKKNVSGRPAVARWLNCSNSADKVEARV